MDARNRLHELMSLCNCRKIRLGNNGEIVIKDGIIKYDHSNAFRYYVKDEYAFEKGKEILIDNYENILKFIESRGKIFSTTMYYKDFDDPKYNKSRYIPHRYDSDVNDSGIIIKGDEFCGTLDQLRKFLNYTNNHNRYCRCCNGYENKEVSDLINTGLNFGLFKYDGFGEYYHGAIVD